ncbi:probable glucan 1,3-beta-glucosidase A [Macadamia integrifolia]|uniref:probable glucan 1,3-beta-glucosidase A n=1 Tax=Macadamia integrifolia TaxID=60698 RepID=UPI001C4E4CC8|nr:probable glucan 1,3-beta-glucosidase A [Macadamia integrifolia]XP_042495606.1 probable glucan 1,3-beta-glucosidase A [Macadamia integrifolia]
MSVKLQKYLSAENGGDSFVVANRASASDWETFRLWRINESTFNLRVFDKKFVGLSKRGHRVRAVAHSNQPGTSEAFQIVRNTNDTNRIRILAPNGHFLQTKTETLVTADYQGDSGWGDDNPSVFLMTIVKTLQGEYQLTNGYGPEKAPQVMRGHWNTYIVEEDFKFMSQKGLNAVRIPVGWWIASDPPPKPFVGGSIQALDNAFRWAQNYSMKIIVDLHAVPGSQNGNDHSGTRDGYQEWGASNIQECVNVIDFLASRYAKNPSLAAVELINEPLAPGVTFENLNTYYKAGYQTVRKHSSSAYVILSNRLGPADAREFLQLGRSLQGSVIDVHYYNLYDNAFNNMNAQQNIDFIYNNRSAQLSEVTITGGPLSFVGEWTAEWEVQGASMQVYQRFAKAQMDVYGQATFGWAYWSYRNVNHHWSLKWMIKNNYIKP